MGITTVQIADAVGRKNMARALGVGAGAISKEVISGSFPPAWYFVVLDLCEAVGQECPRELFKFKSPSVSPEGSLACDSQDTLDRGAAQATIAGKTRTDAKAGGA